MAQFKDITIGQGKGSFSSSNINFEPSKVKNHPRFTKKNENREFVCNKVFGLSQDDELSIDLHFVRYCTQHTNKKHIYTRHWFQK